MKEKMLNKIKDYMLSEASAVKESAMNLDPNIEILVNELIDFRGKLIISGVGKTGHIGKKACATFTSLGIPSIFLHASEAQHGDFGVISKGDIVLILSNSGETKETLEMLLPLKNLGAKTVAISKNANSTLNLNCHLSISYAYDKEIDELNLAPTTSTIVLSSMLDAIAVLVSNIKGFSKNDFHKYHPGGSLGRVLGGDKK